MVEPTEASPQGRRRCVRAITRVITGCGGGDPFTAAADVEAVIALAKGDLAKRDRSSDKKGASHEAPSGGRSDRPAKI